MCSLKTQKSTNRYRLRINLKHDLSRLFWINTNRVLDYLLNNKTIASTISNSSIPVSIVVEVISPDGNQVYGYDSISKANPTTIDGNTISNIDYITKTFVAIVLTNLVNKSIVKLSDPLE